MVNIWSGGYHNETCFPLSTKISNKSYIFSFILIFFCCGGELLNKTLAVRKRIDVCKSVW